MASEANDALAREIEKRPDRYSGFAGACGGNRCPDLSPSGGPLSTYPAIAGCDALKCAMWEWGVETGSHALRLIFGGVFDRFPRVTLVLGHLRETVPYLLSRFDTMARIYGLKLEKRPSEYIREHMFVTTSGMFSAEPLACAMGALGAGRAMFSVDYPYGSADEAASFIETVPLGEPKRQEVAYGNAARLLGLENQ